MEVNIRIMKPEDIKQVQNVAKVSWHATYEGIIPFEIQENFLRAAYNDEMMENRLSKTNLYIAEIKEEIVGFANFSSVDTEGKSELVAIYLLPDQQAKGIGTALLVKGIQSLHGLKELNVSVEQENEIGRRFYLAKGFEIVEEIDDDFDGYLLKTVRMTFNVNRATL